MDVVVGMADGEPADGFVVAGRSKPCPVHDLVGDVRPLTIVEHRVVRMRPDGHMPNRLGMVAFTQQIQRLSHQSVQTPEVPLPVLPYEGFERFRRIEACDDMRILMLVAPPWPVQVADQARYALTSHDLGDHAALPRHTRRITIMTAGTS